MQQRRRLRPLPKALDVEAVECLICGDQGEAFEFRLRGKQAVEGILVVAGHLSGQQGVGRGDVQSLKAGIVKSRVETLNDLPREIELADTKLVGDLEGGHGTHATERIGVFYHGPGLVAEAGVSHDPPEKRMGIQ